MMYIKGIPICLWEEEVDRVECGPEQTFVDELLSSIPLGFPVSIGGQSVFNRRLHCFNTVSEWWQLKCVQSFGFQGGLTFHINWYTKVLPLGSGYLDLLLVMLPTTMAETRGLSSKASPANSDAAARLFSICECESYLSYIQLLQLLKMMLKNNLVKFMQKIVCGSTIPLSGSVLWGNDKRGKPNCV